MFDWLTALARRLARRVYFALRGEAQPNTWRFRASSWMWRQARFLFHRLFRRQPAVLLVLDGPAVLSGFAAITGWCLGRNKRIARIRAWVQGRCVAEAVPTTDRADVRQRFPHYRWSGPCGFRLAPDPGSLPDGTYSLLLQAEDTAGTRTELHTELNVREYRIADGPTYPAHLQGSDREYQAWIAEHPPVLQFCSSGPLLSLVMPVYRPCLEHLRAAVDSVRRQSYAQWELHLCDDGSRQAALTQLLEQITAADGRVHLHVLPENGGISAATNRALSQCRGDYVAFMDQDDLLAPHALQEVARAAQRQPFDLLYTDEDRIDSHGCRIEPFFKPDWSPDLLYSQNYFSHLGVYRRELMQAVGGFRTEFNGSQDYDLVLRCAARVQDPQDIVHIPRVLYHWRQVEGSTALRPDQKLYAYDAARRALQEHFDGSRPGVDVSSLVPGIYRHRWPIPDPAPLVSLIIPTRDGVDLLRACIDSILRLTAYRHFEILVVDNQSTCERTLEYLEALHGGSEGEGYVRVLRYNHVFNFSAINNFAAAHARGSLLGLINNDIEVISPDWLGEMVSHAVRPDVGCVGAKLYYPNDTIQHAGVVLGLGVASHAMRFSHSGSTGYFGRLLTIYNPSAVTGAVMLLRKSVFDAVQGLDADSLPVAFNDVDLCLKARDAGYRNVWTPFAELYHHESVSRGADESPEKRARFARETAVMLKRWGSLIRCDPQYNLNLARSGVGYSLALIEPDVFANAAQEYREEPYSLREQGAHD